jgi:lysine-specific demethylase/histidyl-hydroxylase NO66
VPTAVPTAVRAARTATTPPPEPWAPCRTGATRARPPPRRCTSLDPDDFAANVWGRHASLSRAATLPRDFADLLDLDAADALLSGQGLRTPFVRVAKDGATLAHARFTSDGGVGATIADQVNDTRLARLFAGGATVVLQALHRTHPPIARFTRALAADLGHPVQVNAYVTPPQSQGFAAHHDVHDVFVLQVAGRKRWRVHAPVHPAPLRDQPWTDHRAAIEARAAQEPLLDVVLEPGDALYLPRGFLHAATALGDTSAHLTAGIHVWTRRHLLERILAAADDVEELRATLPLGVDVTDPDAIRAEVERTAKLLAELAGDVGAERVANDLAGEALAAVRPAPVGPFAQSRAADGATLDTRLRWRPDLTATTATTGDRLVVRTADGTVPLPAAAAAALDRLRAGEALAVRDLPGDDGARLRLARTLLRECLTVLA